MNEQTRFGPPIGGWVPIGGGALVGPPTSPPAFIPQSGTTLGAQAPGGTLDPCKSHYVYLWMNDGREFWMWLVYVDSTTASGFRITPMGSVYTGIDLRSIYAFYCSQLR